MGISAIDPATEDVWRRAQERRYDAVVTIDVDLITPFEPTAPWQNQQQSRKWAAVRGCHGHKLQMLCLETLTRARAQSTVTDDRTTTFRSHECGGHGDGERRLVPKMRDTTAGNEPFEPKRGRPTAPQSAAIERAIRDAATQAFLSAGYERTSMEAVAGQAGVPKSTLYKRYPDKRALLRAVLSDRVSAWSAIEPARAGGENLELRLKHLAAEVLNRATNAEVQAFWGLASAAWNGPNEVSERHEAIGYGQMITELEREIRELGPLSGIKAQNPRQVATALMAMLGGWIEFVAPTAADPETEARNFAQNCVELLLRGSAAW
ncbi:MAG: TetR/AcrR family transcriptional regulator [Novosphingobium sp.]